MMEKVRKGQRRLEKWPDGFSEGQHFVGVCHFVGLNIQLGSTFVGQDFLLIWA
jgi:hypothetical protein